MPLVVLVGSPILHAQPASVLQGLDKLYVQVPSIPEPVSRQGIEAAELVRDTSLALSRAGLIVLSVDSNLPDTPFVTLAINAMELPAGEIVFHASLELQEQVLPVRNRDLSTLGSTWYSSRFALSHPTTVRDDVLVAAQSMVDEFLSEWTATISAP